VQKVLGTGTVADLANKAGIGESETTSALASLLPQVIDKISPGGKVPGANDLGGARIARQALRLTTTLSAASTEIQSSLPPPPFDMRVAAAGDCPQSSRWPLKCQCRTQCRFSVRG
jgi:hypothetical protein